MPVPASENARLLIDGEPVGLDRLADAVAQRVIRRLEECGILTTSGIRSRRGKESGKWRDKKNEVDESTDRTPIGDSGESLWSMKMAKDCIATLNERKKRNR
jgi:hypothetical protein